MKHPQSSGRRTPLFEFVEPDPRELAAPEACIAAHERLADRAQHYLRASTRATPDLRSKYSAVATELLLIAADFRREAGLK